MLLSLLSGGDLTTAVISILFMLPIILFALSIHEAAHGYAAFKCGDRTAKAMGRLSINPLRHLDPVGFLCMMLVGFGWAKPVPINTNNFRDRKKGMALSAAAGPAANASMGLLSAVLFGFFSAFINYLVHIHVATFWVNMVYWLTVFFMLAAEINLVFAVFNLLPVPPFDGSRLALVFLPTKTYFAIMKYERQIMLGILIALLVMSNLFHFSPFSWIANKLIDLVSDPVRKLFLSIFERSLLA